MRRLWGPADAIETVRTAIASAKALALGMNNLVLTDGAALAVIGNYFVQVRARHQEDKPRRSRAREHVLTRHHGLCAAPGCSRAAVHEHHILHRSLGGSDALWNRVGLCAAHHLYAVHRGFMTVTGRAGERLVWRYRTGELWITEKDDDVRRGGRRDAAAGDGREEDVA